MKKKTYRHPLVTLEIAPHGPYNMPMIIDALTTEFLKPERVRGDRIFITTKQLQRVVNVLCKSTPGVSFRQLDTEIVDERKKIEGIVRKGVVLRIGKYKGRMSATIRWGDKIVKPKKISQLLDGEFPIQREEPIEIIQLWRLGVNKHNQFFVKKFTNKKKKPLPERWDLVI